MHRSMLQRMLLVVVSVGWWGSVGITDSHGQTCQNNFVCTTFPNTVSAAYATVGGGGGNTANGSSATVGGGGGNIASGESATVGGGSSNTANGSLATVGGGYNNTSQGTRATVSGGSDNAATGFGATIGGGVGNMASQNYATVGGGGANTATGPFAAVEGGGSNTASGVSATVGGGYSNTAQGINATVSGGLANFALGYAATIPGGFNNAAGGNFSFAAGRQAKARHKGAFVWADATATDFASTTLNQFNVRASGGARIFSNSAATVGVRLAPGSNAWSIASDRALKEDFQDIDKQQVLAKVRQLPIQNWKLKDEDGNVRHVGPVAQDFHAAFQLGSDERFIHTGDAVGVSLVAIQALTEQNQTLTKRVDILQQENAGLRKQLSQVVQQVQALMQESQSSHRREVARAE